MMYERARSRRRVPALVDAGRARRHVAWLSEQGVGLKTVAARSGVSQGTLSKLMHGLPGRGPSGRVRPSTESRILAVTPADAADGALVPADPTWENVGRLVAKGWTKAAISRAIGQPSGALDLGHDMVTVRSARAVAGLLEETLPPSPPGAGSGSQPPVEVERVRNRDERADISRFLNQMADILETRVAENSWRRHAACIDLPKWMFFPARGDRKTAEAAQRVCDDCPVRVECGESVKDRKVPGVWGGTTEKRRRVNAAG